MNDKLRRLMENQEDVVFDDIPSDMPLLEDFFEFKVEPGSLVEGKDGKKPRLRGPIGLVEESTANDRYYPRSIMEREIARLLESMTARKMYGELDHPGDGKTKLSRVSHFVTEAAIKENNQIFGELELIPGTVNGDQALAIARAGGTLGVSSRGFGTTVPDKNGKHRVQEDYKLVTWDIVADPANAGAFPSFMGEHKELSMLTLEDLKSKNPDVVEALKEELLKELEPKSRDHAREALREEFETKLQEEGKTIREEAVKSAKEELLKDPDVAGAVGVVRQVKELISPYLFEGDENKMIKSLKDQITKLETQIADQDKGVLEAHKEVEEISGIAKELGYNLYLERKLGDSDEVKKVMSLLGDVKRFGSFDEFKEAVGDIIEALEEEDEERIKYEEKIAKLEKKNQKMQEALEQALTVGSKLGVRAYLEKKLSRHPRAEGAREYISEANPMTKDDVDRLLAAYNRENPLSEDFKRIRSGLKKGKVASSMKSRKPLQEGSENYILGVSLEELKERANRM